ncbi:hypothetical protein, partial [Streptomyces sp. NPDC060187]|uniref:hypothetical protein n=1 Tax=Streptomyces sp. NPDC060187 TaxID=3347067 RepID=UPI003653EEDD
LADGDGGLADGGVAGEGRLDLAEFDPQAPELHLVVGASHVRQLAVGAPADGSATAALRRTVPVGPIPRRPAPERRARNRLAGSGADD